MNAHGCSGERSILLLLGAMPWFIGANCEKSSVMTTRQLAPRSSLRQTRLESIASTVPPGKESTDWIALAAKLVCVHVLASSRLIATPKSVPAYHRPRSSGARETE